MKGFAMYGIGPDWITRRDMNPAERGMSLAAGAMLALRALRAPARMSQLSMLGMAAGLLYTALNGHSPLYRLLGVKPGIGSRGRASVTSDRIVIATPPHVVYAFVRDFSNAPKYMAHVESVARTGTDRASWRERGPLGTFVNWESELVRDEPDRELAWRSTPGSDVAYAGIFRFAPRAGATEVQYAAQMQPLGGALGNAFARALGADANDRVADTLRRLKWCLENTADATEGRSGRAGNLPSTRTH